MRPVAVDYGDDAHAIAWHSGEPGPVNVMRVLGMAGIRRVTVQLLEPLPPSDNRKHLARAAHAAIRAALPSPAPLPRDPPTR